MQGVGQRKDENVVSSGVVVGLVGANGSEEGEGLAVLVRRVLLRLTHDGCECDG